MQKVFYLKKVDFSDFLEALHKFSLKLSVLFLNFADFSNRCGQNLTPSGARKYVKRSGLNLDNL